MVQLLLLKGANQLALALASRLGVLGMLGVPGVPGVLGVLGVFPRGLSLFMLKDKDMAPLVGEEVRPPAVPTLSPPPVSPAGPVVQLRPARSTLLDPPAAALMPKSLMLW